MRKPNSIQIEFTVSPSGRIKGRRVGKPKIKLGLENHRALEREMETVRIATAKSRRVKAVKKKKGKIKAPKVRIVKRRRGYAALELLAPSRGDPSP